MHGPLGNPDSRPHRRTAVSRRAVVGGLGVTAATAALSPLVSAATGSSDDIPDGPAGQDARAFPETRALTAAGAAASALETEFPVRYAGVTWTGPARGAKVRFRGGNGATGDWRALHAGCGAGGDDVPDSGTRNTALVAADGAFGFQLFPPDGATGVRSALIDTTAGPRRAVAPRAKAAAALAGVEVVRRAGWGADESKRFRDGREKSPVRFFRAQALTVHHTATPNNDADPAATMRAIYELHTTTHKFGDIGYHFLVDEAGKVYEGRFSGDDGDPAHDKDGNVVTGFHTGGFNSGNIGIALLGELTGRRPTEAARTSLVALLAELAKRHRLDPAARITYTSPVNGATNDVATLSGHRDWLATECPGGTLYAELPALRDEVARKMGGRFQSLVDQRSVLVTAS